MSKSEDIGVFYTLCCISRGRASEKQPGQLFEPATAAERDDLLAMNAIRPVTEEELALYEKVNAKKAASAVKAEPAAVASEPAKAEPAAVAAEPAKAEPAAVAAEPAKAEPAAVAKDASKTTTATDKLVG